MDSGFYDNAIFELLIFICKKLTYNKIQFKIIGSTAMCLLNHLEYDGMLEKYRYMQKDDGYIRHIDLMIGINQYIQSGEVHKISAILKELGKVYNSEQNNRYIKKFHTRDILEYIGYRIDVTHNENYINSPNPKNIVLNTLIKAFGKCEIYIHVYICNSILKPNIYPHLLSENIFAIYVDETETFSFDFFVPISPDLKRSYNKYTIRSLIESCIYYKKHTKIYSDKDFDYKVPTVPFDKMLVNKKKLKFFEENEDVTFCTFLKPKFLPFKNINKNIIKKVINVNEDIVLSQLKETSYCPICIEEFQEQDMVYLTSCGHFIHGNCLCSYLLEYYSKLFSAAEERMERVIGENEHNKKLCPVCRHDEFTIDIPKECYIFIYPFTDYKIEEKDIDKIPFKLKIDI